MLKLGWQRSLLPSLPTVSVFRSTLRLHLGALAEIVVGLGGERPCERGARVEDPEVAAGEWVRTRPRVESMDGGRTARSELASCRPAGG
jgi:hypothetical protein